MIRIIVAIVLIVHGLVHLLGFVVPWRLATVEGFAYKTTLLSDNLDVGDAGIRVVGLLWLLAAIGFVATGVAVFTLRPWWQDVTLWVTLFSLVICILGWPDSKFGVLINLIIMGYLLFGGRMGWLPQTQ
ncbi:MAG: ABC transporter permease [Candidatus Methanofastidiosia archaeon]